MKRPYRDPDPPPAVTKVGRRGIEDHELAMMLATSMVVEIVAMVALDNQFIGVGLGNITLAVWMVLSIVRTRRRP